MEQLTLPRQSRAEAVLRAAAARNALSHALLITGGGDRLAAARFAAAALLCSGEGSRPCGRCAHCRKVMGGIHPDVTVVEDPEHKNIAVDIVLSAQPDT